MQVIWLDEAKALFKEAISFGMLAFGEKAVIRFVDEVQKTDERLSVFPLLGKIEPSLKGLGQEYRSLVIHRNYKVIYYIDDDIVFIASFWSTRCDPESLRSEIKKTRQYMEVKIINKSHHPLPGYATELSAGMDIRANLTEPVVLKPLERKLIPTGLYIALPEGYEAQMRPRSGLALKHGITLLNTPGTIDADYRGEIGVILVNLSSEPFTVNDGERICQMVIATYNQVSWKQVEVLDETERGAGGFGHTGKQ